MLRLFLLLICLLCPCAAPAARPLQPLIDATAPGGTLRLAAGAYAGPAVIDKTMVLDGGGAATLDGAGQGTVLTVRARGAIVRGLRIVGSGDLHDRLDAGVLIEGDDNLVEDNRIEDVLFGVVMSRADGNRVRGNRIRSRHDNPAERGDAVRLWYSRFNRIEGNDIARARDIALANAAHNRIVGNRIRDGRTGLHMIFSPRTLVEGNELSGNTGGIFALNSDGLVVRGNRILHAMSASGAAIGLKETDAALILGNEIVHCAVGILADSPVHPVNRITVVGNRIAHTITGITFYGEKGGHIVRDNRFEHNLAHAVLYGSGDPLANDWLGNDWDDYEGFDRDGDGVGDTPYEVYAFADRIWIENPQATFFRKAPAMELLDILERLAPFASPALILRDAAPRVRRR
jgi:nitrous oxidase accessory protein